MRPTGFTLLESIIVIIIAAIIFSAAIPLFKNHPEHDLNRVTQQLTQHLELAKSVALAQQTTVTVCGSSDSLTCDHQWHKGYIIFKDNMGKGIKEKEEPLIAFKHYEQEMLDIRWKGFLSQEFIQFFPQFGQLTQGQNGTLTLSDTQGNNQRVIINSAGRIRVQKG